LIEAITWNDIVEAQQVLADTIYLMVKHQKASSLSPESRNAM